MKVPIARNNYSFVVIWVLNHGLQKQISMVLDGRMWSDPEPISAPSQLFFPFSTVKLVLEPLPSAG